MIEFEDELRSRSSSRFGGMGCSSRSVVSYVTRILRGYVLGKEKTCHDVSQVQRNAMVRSKSRQDGARDHASRSRLKGDGMP